MNVKCDKCGASKPKPSLEEGLCLGCREFGVPDATFVEAETGLADQDRVNVSVAVEEGTEEESPQWETWNA